MLAAQQASGRLSMQQLGLNIYSCQPRKQSARICRRQGRARARQNLRLAMWLSAYPEVLRVTGMRRRGELHGIGLRSGRSPG